MFWESLGLVGQIYFIIGCVASGLLLIQLILLLIGFSGDSDVDMGDSDPSDGGLGIFTVKGLIAFFAIGSWVALAAFKGGLHWGWTIPIFFFSGALALIGVGFLYKYAYKLTSNGTMSPEQALGKTGEVYLTIPSNNSGAGKLTITIQGKSTEVDCITYDAEPIMTGQIATVNEIVGDVFVVSAYTRPSTDTQSTIGDNADKTKASENDAEVAKEPVNTDK